MEKKLLIRLLLVFITFPLFAQQTNSNIPVSDIEYQALVDFYKAMGESNWSNKWNTRENNLHEVPWYGVTTENGHVTAINLYYTANVAGAIPSSFANLKYLKALSLNGENSTKDLSNTDLGVLSELESLENLDLKNSKIKGVIPASWNKLKKLKTLYLSYNAITALPEEIGELENITILYADNNQIKKLPESIGNLSKLVTLDLSYNQIEGAIPKSFEQLNTLTSLQLFKNKISDTKAFLKSSVYLRVDYQDLNIDELLYKGVDVKINTLPNILYYSRSKNDFSSKNQFSLYVRGSQAGTNLTVAQDGSLTLPSSFLATLKTGDQVYLYQRSGDSNYSTITFTTVKVNQPKVPDAEYQALVDFNKAMNGSNWSAKWNTTENNLHEGAWNGISIENGHITGINLNNTSYISGAIPASFANLKYLKSFTIYGGNYSKDLSNTDLGVLSELENLESLDLRYCKLKGSLPASWSKLKKLKTLYLSYNAITALPEEIGELENIDTLYADNNQIKKLPESIGNLSKLVTLDLSYNQIETSIPKNLEQLNVLTSLQLYKNKIPDTKAFLNSRVYLRVDYQDLDIDELVYRGEDVKINTLPNIVYYSRSKNDFSVKNQFAVYLRGSIVGTNLTVAQDGSLTIPSSYFASLKTGDQVYLYQRSGDSNYSTITFTTVKVNQPKVPDAEYQALVDFNTAMNGSNWSAKWNTAENNLHEGAWNGVSIENGHITGINLNNTNYITGAIPASFGNLKYLKNLSLYGGGYSKDLSSTDLGVLSQLENLESLDLRYCKIKGALPTSWKKLKKLKTLYINNNTINSLPEDFGEIENLVTLDLSYNQIKTVPASIGSLSNLETLYLGNNQIESLLKEFENLGNLKTLGLSYNKVSDIKGLLKSQVSIELNTQTLTLENFLYEGADVKITNLPNSVIYNRTKNDFSGKPQFIVYIRSSAVGSTLTADEDGNLTIPASYLTTLKTGDQIYLYQQYQSTSQSTYYSKIYFTTVKVDQPKVPDAEYQALVDFNTVMNGNNWSTKWNIAENNLHEGAWNGISIENGHITGINLNNTSYITGAIPASFGNLKYLKSLSLYGGGYSKDLSSTDLGVLSQLENLENLDLRYCKIKGSLPASWSKLKKLKTLYVSNNAVSSLPEEFGEIENIVTLDLSYNQIKTVPASIGNLSNLETLYLGNNQLEVLLKEFENLGNLKTLGLSYNKVSDIKGLLKSQVNIDLSTQTLTIEKFLYEGTDVKITNLPNSVLYNRAKNDFSAKTQFLLYIRSSVVGSALTVDQDGTLTIPASYLATLKTGDQIYLYQQYQSTSQITYYSNINFTTVKVDQPRIPDAEYQALVDFNTAMNGNNWSTKWDTTVNNLHEGPWYGVSIQDGHITAVNLNNNSNIKGAIPASFGNLKYLKNLSLYGANYTKDLSYTDLKIISELESLEYLDMRYCKVKGVIPSSWSKLKNLKTLYLSSNNIEDADETLADLPLLKSVDLKSQTITIPTIEIGANELIINLPTLSTMVFDTNGASINNTNYFTLYINNLNKASTYSNKEGVLIFKDIALLSIKLTDKIKIIQNDGAAQFTTINYATVAFGKLLEEEEFEILKKFYISTNGEQWTQKWDTSQNKLHEASWYGVGTKEGHVISLNLAGNNLSGTLPLELSGLKYLETLNLQSNAIEGDIPANLGQLTNLKTIYLQDNKLNGKLPLFSAIAGLKKLSLARNQFAGTIPTSFNDFQNIEQLDLSNNNFDALEAVFTYDLNKVYLNLRNQNITKDEYLYLKGDEISLDLPTITTYDETNQNYDGKYLFALQANNFKIAEAVSEGNTLVFPNITSADIPTGAKITIWQRTGASQGTYLHYNGIADGSETPLLAAEYQALVAFFEQAGGPNWTEPWDISTNNLHEKRWKGVTTNDGHIVSIKLVDNNLTGSISPELDKFTELQMLNLSHNKLTGSIPEVLSQLTKLKTVDLSENELTGISTTFPANLSFKLDRQKIDLGQLPLTLNAVIKDKEINHYDHNNTVFSAAQSYNMTLKDNYKMLNIPEDGFKLMNIMSEWNIPNHQTMELRQIAGSARNSVLTYTFTYREGDSNLDGIINILDIQSSLNYILNQKPKYFNYGAADINKDKNLNLLDIILLINKIQEGSLEKTASTKRLMASNDEKALLSIEDGVLYIDNPSESTAAFDIRLKGENKEQVKELLSSKGYTMSVAEKGEEISLIGFSMSETLSGKQAIAKVSPETTIVSAMISNDTAIEVPYKIVSKTLAVDDVDIISKETTGVINYPNPFKDQTTIQYQLLENANQVTLKIYNMQGQVVRIQSDLQTSEGKHEFNFLRQELASGVYLYTVEIETQKGQKVYKGKMLIQ